MTSRRWILVLAVLVVAVGCGGSESTKERYEDRNQLLLERLPLFPESELLGATTNPYFDEGSEKAVGYTTNAQYSVPAATTAEQVVDFFVEELADEWEVELEALAGVDLTTGEAMESLPLAHFTRDAEMVSINPDNVGAQQPRFELVVDYKGAD